MIEFSSVVPERENLPYYIITMDWFTKWQKYTGCYNMNAGDEEMDQDNLVLGDYPNGINSNSGLAELLKVLDGKIIAPDDDYYGKFYLKNGKKENQDFKLVDAEVWNIL